MGRLAEISLGDLARALGRYRPIALAVLAILAVVAVTDAPERRLPSAAADYRPTDAELGGNRPVDEGSGDAPDTLGSSDAPPFTSAPAPSFGGSSSFGAAPSPGDGAGTAPPPTTGSSDFDGFAFDADEQQEPLTVVKWAWASRSAGTPLADAGVPEDTLPVGDRAGRHDKVSFVKLEGDGTTLYLAEDPEGERVITGDPQVQACTVLESGWREAAAMSFSDAPTWNEESCVLGRRSADGTWTFDVGRLGDPTTQAGFALVPAPEAPIDFQVTFQDSVPATAR